VPRSAAARTSALAAVLLNLVVLYAPRVPAVPTGGLPADKLVHVVVFALPTIALAWAGVPWRWVVAGMAGHALLSEVLQAAVLPDRSGDPWDVVADLLGIALGVAVLGWLGRRSGRSRAPRPGSRAGVPEPGTSR
jgi:VanZ family protein